MIEKARKGMEVERIENESSNDNYTLFNLKLLLAHGEKTILTHLDIAGLPSGRRLLVIPKSTLDLIIKSTLLIRMVSWDQHQPQRVYHFAIKSKSKIGPLPLRSSSNITSQPLNLHLQAPDLI